MQTPPATQLISLTFDDVNAVPLGHEPLVHNGLIIGQTTSCAFGYRVGKPIALAHSNKPLSTGTTLHVDIAGTLYLCCVSVEPLFDAAGRCMKHADKAANHPARRA